MGESAVEELVAPVYAKWKDDPVTILASPGRGAAPSRGAGPARRGAKSGSPPSKRISAAALGSRIFGEDGEDLARVVGRLLREGGRTVAFAESCTGGMVSSLVTDVPGSSAYFLGGVVTYANAAKEESPRRGPGDAPALRRRLRGDRPGDGAGRPRAGSERTSASRSPGSPGPDGGTAEKPVGTVHFALADRSGAEVARKRVFVGDRAVVRRAASIQALELLRRHLSGEEA